MKFSKLSICPPGIGGGGGGGGSARHRVVGQARFSPKNRPRKRVLKLKKIAYGKVGAGVADLQDIVWWGKHVPNSRLKAWSVFPPLFEADYAVKFSKLSIFAPGIGGGGGGGSARHSVVEQARPPPKNRPWKWILKLMICAP